MTESQLLNQAIKHIYNNYSKFVFRVNVGTVKTADGRKFSTGVPVGFSDLMGTLPNGRSFYIELKVKPNKPTQKQIEFIENAKKHFALAGIAYSIEDINDILEPF